MDITADYLDRVAGKLEGVTLSLKEIGKGVADIEDELLRELLRLCDAAEELLLEVHYLTSENDCCEHDPEDIEDFDGIEDDLFE